jgi:hypothetical protein
LFEPEIKLVREAGFEGGEDGVIAGFEEARFDEREACPFEE